MYTTNIFCIVDSVTMNNEEATLKHLVVPSKAKPQLFTLRQNNSNGDLVHFSPIPQKQYVPVLNIYTCLKNKPIYLASI